MPPKISIITITYNSGKTLEETIVSVITQDYPNLEYIIIDGGSTDNTHDIVHKYRDNISIFVSEPDKGISDAFNKGIRYSTGEIVGIINSDDILLHGALLEISENYNKKIDIYSGVVQLWDDKTNNTIDSFPEIRFDKLKLQYGVAHPSRFIRRDAYDRYGLYDERLRYMMDIELLVRFYKNGASFAVVNKALAKFRLNGVTADSIYKKKNDYRLFVMLYGGTNLDFWKIWVFAIIKYNLIQIGYFVFGDDLKFKIDRNPYLKKVIDLIV